MMLLRILDDYGVSQSFYDELAKTYEGAIKIKPHEGANGAEIVIDILKVAAPYVTAATTTITAVLLERRREKTAKEAQNDFNKYLEDLLESLLIHIFKHEKQGQNLLRYTFEGENIKVEGAAETEQDLEKEVEKVKMSLKKENERHTEYPLFDKVLNLNYLCRIMSIYDGVDLTGMSITEDEGILCRKGNTKNILIGRQLKHMLCEFNVWSGKIEQEFVYDSANHIRKFVYASIAKDEIDEKEKDNIRLQNLRASILKYLENHSLYPTYDSRPQDTYNNYLGYQVYFLLGHEIAHEIFAQKPTIEKNLCAKAVELLTKHFVDEQNTMLDLLNEPLYLKEISCDFLGALAVLNLFPEIAKSTENIVDCALALMLAVLCLKLPVIRDDLTYDKKKETNRQKLSDLRVFVVFYHIANHLVHFYPNNPEIANAFTSQFERYYKYYRKISAFVAEEIQTEMTLTDNK